MKHESKMIGKVVTIKDAGSIYFGEWGTIEAIDEYNEKYNTVETEEEDPAVEAEETEAEETEAEEAEEVPDAEAEETEAAEAEEIPAEEEE